MDKIYSLSDDQILDMLAESSISKYEVRSETSPTETIGIISLDDKFYRVIEINDEVRQIEEVIPEPVIQYDYRAVKRIYPLDE